MQAARRLRVRVRRRVGRAAHGAGAATRKDIWHLLSEQERLASQIADLTDASQRVSGLVDSLQTRQQQLDGRITGLERQDLDARIAGLERAAAIQFFGRFIQHVQLNRHPLVSVVLPTRDRPEFLQRAIASLLAQRYEAW